MKKILLPFLLFCNVCTSFCNNCTSDSTAVSLTDLQNSIDALTAEDGMAKVIFSDNAYLFNQTIRVSNNAFTIVFTSDSSTTFYGKCA